MQNGIKYLIFFSFSLFILMGCQSDQNQSVSDRLSGIYELQFQFQTLPDRISVEQRLSELEAEVKIFVVSELRLIAQFPHKPHSSIRLESIRLAEKHGGKLSAEQMLVSTSDVTKESEKSSTRLKDRLDGSEKGLQRFPNVFDLFRFLFN